MDAELIDDVLRGLPLRDYQRDAVRALLNAPGAGGRVDVVSLPTGSGKTLVGVAAAACLVASGHTVLWTCKRWALLRAAAEALVGHFPEFQTWLRRIGGASTRFELGQLPDGANGWVYFTTLQSWYRRRQASELARLDDRPLAVVWDEVHWGFSAAVGRALRERYASRRVLGMTATPPPSACADVVYQKVYADLVGSVLATPVVESASTGVTWAPTLRGDDYSPESLGALARAADRNTCIVDRVVALRERGRARHTIVYAISVPHAHELAERLGARGVPTGVVHCRQPRAAQERAVEAFRQHTIDVLINVGMLAEGFDFPPTDAVVLARPCTSRALLTQMIGRGARKAPGKDGFVVVDVRDDLTRYGDLLVRAADVVPAAPVPDRRPRDYHPPTRHAEPKDPARFENYTVPDYGTLPIATGQTFGVEIELTSATGVPARDPAWESVARAILEKLGDTVAAPVSARPLDDKGGPLTHWRVVYDCSAGWEVVSPILSDAGGFDELRRACAALSDLVAGAELGLRVNYRTGLHVTLATRPATDERLAGFVRLVQRLEPGLFTLVAPSRLYAFDGCSYAARRGNSYCLPLRALGDPTALNWDDFRDEYENRYHSVNLIKSADSVPLLEVRMHHGTYEFPKIALWTCLWMQIFNAARFRWGGAPRPGPVLPGRNRKISRAGAGREDVVALLREEGIALTPEFVALLRRRRSELRSRWQQAVPNRVAGWAAAGWYEDAPRPLPVR